MLKTCGARQGHGLLVLFFGSQLVDLGQKSGRKSNVSDLLSTEFERPDLNWHSKGALAECNIIVHVAAAHLFTVVDKLRECKVPTWKFPMRQGLKLANFSMSHSQAVVAD